jgi:hypothetical protein
MKRWAAALGLFLLGCERPPDTAFVVPRDLAGHITYDFGDPARIDLAAADALPDLGTDDGPAADDGPPAPPADLAPAVDGNRLALDGGSGYAHLWFSISDSDTQLPVPARVIFRPVPGSGFADNILLGTPFWNSPGSSTGALVGPGVLGSPEGVLLQSGQGVVPVPAGTYTLFFTRGPEYDAEETTVTVAAGEARAINVELQHTVDTGGWLSADMHVHTAVSFDSRLPVDRRVISMVSNGIELIVPTEHNGFIDLKPYIAALGYGTEVVGTVPGDEFNFAEGHGGAYPVTSGIPPWTGDCDKGGTGIDCKTAADAFPFMHNQVPGVTVVTVNHPWWGGADLGYFTNINWGAGTSKPLPATLATAGLFDAMEVLNGYWTREDAEGYLVADWFYLIGQGYRVTALGNSDTHKINWVRSGWPRTWLRLPTDKPGEVTGAMLADAIKNGRAIASTGPFVLVTVDDAQIGDTVVPKKAGQVTIAITVDAPPWIDVDTVRVYVNGYEKHVFSVVPGSRPVFQTQIVEPIDSDSWVVVFASGSKALPPDVVGESSHINGWEMRPLAITNPIFIDADSTAGWQSTKPWTGTPVPHPTSRLLRPRTYRLRPLDEENACIYRGEREPPLDAPGAPERYLMPLLYH